MNPKTKQILFFTGFSLPFAGIAVVFIALAWLIGQAFSDQGEEFTFKLGNPPATYVVVEHVGFQLESDITYILYKKDGWFSKARIGSSGGLYKKVIRPDDPSTSIPILELYDPNNPYKDRETLFYYKPATKELIPI